MATIAELTAVITADTSGFDAGVDSANQKLQELGQTGGDTAEKLTTSGKLMAGIGAAITAPLVGAVKQAADFDYAMDGVNAALGGVDTKTLDLLSQQALDLGASSQYSANEIADVQQELAKSGLTAEEILGGATKAVTDLAAATGESLPSSTKLVSDALNMFQLDAEQSTRVADIFTTGLNESSMSVEDLQRGLNYLGPVLQNQNRYLEMSEQGLDGNTEALIDATAAMAVFNQRGLKGANIGNSLARMYTELADPTSKASQAMEQYGIAAFDAEGNLKPLPDIIDNIGASLSGLSDQERQKAISDIFGEESKDTIEQMVAAFQKGGLGDDIRDVADAMHEEGTAAKQAAIRQDNLTGAVEQLGGALNGLAIQMGTPLLDPIKEATKGVTKMVDALAEAPPEVQKLVAEFGALSGGLLTVGGGALWGTGKILDLGQSFKNAGLSLGKFTLGLGALGLLLGAGLLAYETNFLGFGDAVDEAMANGRVALDRFGKTFGEVFSAQKARGMNDVANAVDSFGKALFDATGVDWLEQTATLGRALDVLQNKFAEGAAQGVDPWVNALNAASEAAAAAGDPENARQLSLLSDAWQAMADNMAETEGKMPQLNRELSALQHGAGVLLGPDGLGAVENAEDVPRFFDDLGMQAAKAQQDLQNLRDSINQGDWRGVWDQLTAVDGEHHNPLDSLQQITDGITDWFQDTSNLLMGTADQLSGSGDIVKGSDGLVEQLGNNIGQSFAGLGDAVMQAIPDGNPFQPVQDWLQQGMDEVANFFMPQEMPAGLGGAGMGDTSGIQQWFSGMVDGIGAGMDQAIADLGALKDEKVAGFTQALGDLLGPIGQFLFPSQDALAGAEGALGDPAKMGEQFGTSLINTLKDPAFQEGIQKSIDGLPPETFEAMGTSLLSALNSGMESALMKPAPDTTDGQTAGQTMGQNLVSTLAAGLQQGFVSVPPETFVPAATGLVGQLNNALGVAMADAETQFVDPSREGSLPLKGGGLGQQMAQQLATGLTAGITAAPVETFLPATTALGTRLGEAMTAIQEGAAAPTGLSESTQMQQSFGAQMVEGMAAGLASGITAADPATFVPVTNALGTQLGAAMQMASQQTQAPGGVGPAGPAVPAMGETMVQGLATGLASGITAADPALFVPVSNALGSQLGAAMSMAAQQTQAPGGVGPQGPAVPALGSTMVEGLAQGLTDSITATPPETFYPVANALGSQLGTALNDAMTKTVGVGENTTGGMVGEDAAGGIGAQMVSNLATGLSDSITNAPEEVFTPVGAALGTKMTEALQAAVEGGAQGTAGADGATGVGQQMGEAVGQMLISGVEQADWAPVGTSLSTKLGETLQTVATENGDISTQLGDSVGQMLQQGVEGADFSGVGEQLTTQLNDQMTSAIEDVSSQISDSMSQITEAISEAVSQMGEAIGEATEQVSQAVEEMSQSIEEATESVSQAVEEMSQSVEQAGEAMSQAAEEASSSAEEIGTAAEEAAAAVEAAMQSMAAAVQAAAGAIASAAGQIVASLNQIAGAAQAASSAVGAVGGMAPAGGAGGTARSAEVGEAMVQGTARGMETAAPMVARSSQLVADTAYDAMADAVQMGSPAERFVPVGRSITQGMMKGMLAEAKSRLKSAMGKMAGQVASAMGKIKSAMAQGIGQVQSRIKEAMGRVQGEAASGGQAAGAAAARGSAAGVDSASDENEKAVRRMWKKALKKLLEGKGEMRFLGEEFAREFWLGMLDTAGSLEFAQFVTDQAVAAAENAIEAIRAKMQGLATQLEIVGNTIADLESELASIDSQLAAMDAAAAEEAARAAAQARIDAAQELLDKQREITAELEKQFSREFNEAHQAHIRAVQAGSKGAPQAEYEAKLAKATQTNSLLQQSKAMEEHLAKELEMIRKAIEAESKARADAAKAQARAELEARREMLAAELAAAKQQQAELAAAQHAAQVQYTQTVIAESEKRIKQLQREKKQADSPEDRAKAQAEIALEKQKIELANKLAEALERQANAKSPEALAEANAQVQYYTEALAALEEVDIGAMLEELVSKMGEVATSMSSAATSMGDAAAAMSSMEAPATAAASSVSEVGQAAGGAAGGMQDMGAKYHEVMSQMAADGYAFQEQFKAMTDQVRGTAETAGTDIGLALSDGITNRITQGGPALQQAMVDGLQTGVDAADAVADKGGDDIATSFGQAMRDTLGVQFPPLQEQIRTGLQKPIDDGIKAAEKGGTDIGKGLMGEAKVGLDNGSPPFQRTVKKTIDDPVRDGIRAANQGGRQIGNALGDGMQQGVRDRAKAIADEAARTVRDAVNAANREARAHSPSEEMREVGHNLGDGLIYGMRDRRRDAHEESERLIHIPRLSPMDDGGVTGNRARRSGDSAGRTIHIENLNLPGVQDGPQLVEYLENLMRTNGVSAGRR